MVPTRATPPADDVEARPMATILVYTWDMLLAILALFGALAAFGGGILIGGREVRVPLVEQIVEALASAAFAAALITVAVLLPRRQAWVRRAQIVVLALSVGFAVLSLALGGLGAGGKMDVSAILGTVFFALLDLLGILLMTGPKVKAWYRDPGGVPAYVSGTVGFWVAASGGLLVAHLVG